MYNCLKHMTSHDFCGSIHQMFIVSALFIKAEYRKMMLHYLSSLKC